MTNQEAVRHLKNILEIKKNEQILEAEYSNKPELEIHALEKAIAVLEDPATPRIKGRKHGMWSKKQVAYQDAFGDFHAGFQCSECKAIINKGNFCSNCGAIMDLT